MRIDPEKVAIYLNVLRMFFMQTNAPTDAAMVAALREMADDLEYANEAVEATGGLLHMAPLGHA